MDEKARLATLRHYRILDTEPEQAFDDLTLLASHICATPIALITLVDADRQWFKSRVGTSVTETARSVAFCAHAIEEPDDILVVPDALDDARFRENPLVTGELGIRFYAGAPLVTPEGQALGTLCVIDRVPRRLTAAQMEALDALRHQAEAQLELRRRLQELSEALAERDKAEQEQRRLNGELNEALQNVRRLSALLPFCSTCQINMVIPADPRAIHTVTDGVTHMLQEKHWDERKVMEVELALQEALANAIRHGCGGDPSRHLQCIVAVEDTGEAMIVVRDPGTGFDTTRVANPLAPENVLKPSGRGIFLINQLMDEVAFSDGGRELQMKKRRGGGDARESEAASNATQSSGPVTAATPESTTRSR
ncbi:MAG TPA: ATP-binding protein [Vicinamibacterales bacterium]|jgi:anti-sigma regulatory factor (Ser/Thr protein kinase)|nr:ATP-binding protein [Vicinamibacterales bacterium]